MKAILFGLAAFALVLVSWPVALGLMLFVGLLQLLRLLLRKLLGLDT